MQSGRRVFAGVLRRVWPGGAWVFGRDGWREGSVWRERLWARKAVGAKGRVARKACGGGNSLEKGSGGTGRKSRPWRPAENTSCVFGCLQTPSRASPRWRCRAALSGGGRFRVGERRAGLGRLGRELGAGLDSVAACGWLAFAAGRVFGVGGGRLWRVRVKGWVRDLLGGAASRVAHQRDTRAASGRETG